jgi:hypothetical protein
MTHDLPAWQKNPLMLQARELGMSVGPGRQSAQKFIRPGVHCLTCDSLNDHSIYDHLPPKGKTESASRTIAFNRWPCSPVETSKAKPQRREGAKDREEAEPSAYHSTRTPSRTFAPSRLCGFAFLRPSDLGSRSFFE